MRLTILPTTIAAAALLGGCSPQPAQSDMDAAKPAANIAGADLTDADGKAVGRASLTQVDDTVAIEIAVTGLEQGQRAFHLHETGSCEAPDFTSAGGHLNPYGRSHGNLNPQGQHLGDLPNLEIGSDGAAKLTFTFSDDPDQLAAQIFDEDGTAVMLHAGPDDYASDPAGAAGPRIACGVLTRE